MARFGGSQLALAGVVAAALFAVGFGAAHGLADDDAPARGKSTGGGKSAAEREREDIRNAEKGWYDSTLKLKDGRTVQVRLVEGTGVRERHRAAGSDKWSAWQTLFLSDQDRCQGVDLEEANGTVSLIADFGPYCSDGEPPQESVAAIGAGDLTKWEVDTTEGFDGWADASINDDGDRAVFLYNSDSGLYTLRWATGEGFEEIVRPKR